MTRRIEGITFSFHTQIKKTRRKTYYLLILRMGEKIQKHLKVKAGDKIAIMHDFNNEFILYLQNMKNITHQYGYILTPSDALSTNEKHQKKLKKPGLFIRKSWASFKLIPEWAKKSSRPNYVLLPNKMVLIDLKIKT